MLSASVLRYWEQDGARQAGAINRAEFFETTGVLAGAVLPTHFWPILRPTFMGPDSLAPRLRLRFSDSLDLLSGFSTRSFRRHS